MLLLFSLTVMFVITAISFHQNMWLYWHWFYPLYLHQYLLSFIFTLISLYTIYIYIMISLILYTYTDISHPLHLHWYFLSLIHTLIFLIIYIYTDISYTFIHTLISLILHTYTDISYTFKFALYIYTDVSYHSLYLHWYLSSSWRKDLPLTPFSSFSSCRVDVTVRSRPASTFTLRSISRTSCSSTEGTTWLSRMPSWLRFRVSAQAPPSYQALYQL